MRGDVKPLAGMTPVFLEPKPMPYLQHLSNNNNNNLTSISSEENNHASRNISPPIHETSEDSKPHISNVSNNGSINSQPFYHHEHEKYGIQ